MPAIDPSDAAFVRDLVYKRAAITLDEGKGYLIESRLGELVRSGTAPSIQALVAEARKGVAKASTQIVEAITTHETLFFRDFEPFEAMKKTVLPQLCPANGPPRKLTIWSAACSSGQEPYSIAMLLLEHFPQQVKTGVRIIATDLSQQILDKAKEGRFRQLEVNRGLPVQYLMKYFINEHNTHYALKDEVKKLVEFRQSNLVENWSLPAKPDVVFLRNVLIYFDNPTKAAILKRVQELLPSDGVLFLGTAETTINVTEGFERVPAGRTAYYRVKR